MLIYLITNLINNKIYIGQTCRSFDERKKEYTKEYNRINPNSKKCRLIIRAIHKYGIENFKFEILHDNIKTKEELNKLERKYIKLYNSTIDKNGYNIELGGNGIGKHSEQTKKKISEAQLGEKNHMFGKIGKDNSTSKAIIDITTGKIYASASDIMRELKVSDVSKICAVARGERISAYNKIFRYVDSENHPIIVNFPKTKICRQSILNKTKNIIYI